MKKLPLLIAALATTTAACLDDSITGTRPLDFSLTTETASAPVGSDVTFRYDAQGTGLSLVRFDFGDGLADSVAFPGAAVEGEGTIVHAFGLAGTYTVRGQALTFIGTATDSVTVTIN
jgi:hypothetical protein